MLHTETVERKTFELLTALMQDEKLKAFNLVGGTALALYLGHRKSIDIDMFTQNEFDAKKLKEYMIEKYNFEPINLSDATLMGFVSDVKIDFIAHKYPYIEQLLLSKEGIRLVSMIDIAAMKLSAIADSGTRLKDFVDIAYLSSTFSLEEMLSVYEKKFRNTSRISPIKGLIYFQDINFNEPVNMIDTSFNWKVVEKRLHEMIKNPNRIFPNPFTEEQHRKRGLKL